MQFDLTMRSGIKFEFSNLLVRDRIHHGSFNERLVELKRKIFLFLKSAFASSISR